MKPTVLVGTYRKDQLAKWILPRGLYNYPVREDDSAIHEAAPGISELWLYAGKKDKLRFSASFDREVAAADLAALGYPRGKGKPHAERYLLFSVEPINEEFSRPDAKSAKKKPHAKAAKSAKDDSGAHATPPRVLLRLRDFARSPKRIAELRELLARREDPATSPQNVSYFDDLPDDLLEDWLGNLCVCEAGEQLTFWDFRDEGGPALAADYMATPRGTRIPPKRTSSVQSPHDPEKTLGTQTITTPHVVLGDSLVAIRSWAKPMVIVSDGPYGLSSYPGDPTTPEGLADWYKPHLEAWYEMALPSCTLWFWNSEQGWANCHRMIEDCGWEFRNCHIWDKGMSHVAGNVNTKTIRKYPVVTEVCVQYVRKNMLPSAGKNLPLKDWLRAEWERTGLPFRETNIACGVKDAATRKYFSRDHLWYFPPSEAFLRIADYANHRGRSAGRPYFAKPDGTPFLPAEWEGMRAKFRCEMGVTNVWHEPPVRGVERLKGEQGVLHMNQKPLSLLELAIRASSDPDDVVWEPFGGLCSATIAAMRLGRRAFAAEINPLFHRLATERIQNEKQRLPLL